MNQSKSSKQILDEVTVSSDFTVKKYNSRPFFFRYTCNTLSFDMVSLKGRASAYAIGWTMCLDKNNVIDNNDHY